MQEAVAANNSHHHIQDRKPGLMADMLGQFATRKFWREMFRLVVQEVLAAVFITGGGMLMWYGKTKRHQDVPDFGGGDAANRGTVTEKAFGGGYSPRPSYQPGGSYSPPATIPSAPAPDRFPGF